VVRLLLKRLRQEFRSALPCPKKSQGNVEILGFWESGFGLVKFSQEETMLWKHGCLISTLRRVIRSQILMGLLCLFVLVFLMRVTPNSCNAFDTEKAHKNHFHIAPRMIWDHSSMPRPPFEHRCSCSFSMSTCCTGTIYHTPKRPYVSLSSRDSARQLSLLQASMIRPFDSKLLSQRARRFRDFNSINQEEFFLVNCTFLI